MIVAALLHLTARSNPALRRLGLVGDSVALWSRATRQSAAWRDHEERCRAFVAAMIEGLVAYRTVIVLGSGLMRDVPLAVLDARFRHVVLVDAVHLLPARRQAARAGAEIVVADLSGGDAAAIAALQTRPEIDLVISANLLSQMPLAHRRQADDWDSPEPLRRIGQTHLDDLAGFGCPICLLSDIGYRDVAADGTNGAETPLIDISLLPQPAQSWDWVVAPRGEIDRAFARHHRVGAWLLLPGDIRRNSH